MSDQPPVQRNEAWMEKATPEEVVAADDAWELHLIRGGQVDDEGWPADSRGRRLNIERKR